MAGSDETLRDKSGKWLPGTPSPNPNGRLPRKIEQQRIETLQSVLTDEDWAEIVKVAIAHAKAGDATARNWVSSYAAGKPIDRVEMTNTGADTLADLTDDQIDDILHGTKVSSDGPDAA